MIFIKAIKTMLLDIYSMIRKGYPQSKIDSYIQVVLGGVYDQFFKKNMIANLQLVEKETIKLSNFYKIPYKFNKDLFQTIQGKSLLSANTTWTNAYSQKEINKLKRLVAQNLYSQGTEAELKQTLMDQLGYTNRQAQIIARTETLRCKNTAVNMIWDSDNDEQYDKVWVAVLDDRTRDDHADMDGAIADPVTGLFDTTWGEQLEYPGSGNDPAENCNCRCTIKLVKREKESK